MPKASSKNENNASPERPKRGISAGNAPVKRKREPPKSAEGRTPFILRFESDVYVGIKELAEQAGVSINQLMEGITRWVVMHARAGEPVVNEDGEVIGEVAERGCIWAGETAEEAEVDGTGKSRGVWMCLDFTNRRVVREDV